MISMAQRIAFYKFQAQTRPTFELPKLHTRVRFPSPAHGLNASGIRRFYSVFTAHPPLTREPVPILAMETFGEIELVHFLHKLAFEDDFPTKKTRALSDPGQSSQRACFGRGRYGR